MASGRAGAEAADATGTVRFLVDDEPGVGSVTAGHVERHLDDVAAVTETSGEAAIERFDGDVDCVVTDYEMPDRDGLDPLHRVRDRDPDLPLIRFTARRGEEIASDAIPAGVTDHLQRSAGIDRLANRIENAVVRWRPTG